MVFRYLTESDLLLEWMAVEADAHAVAGGALRWRHENGDTMIGRFVELTPPNRLVFRYGWEGGINGVAPEASLVEIDLDEANGRTTLRLRQSLLPPDAVEAHRHGWDYFLSILAQRLTGAMH